MKVSGARAGKFRSYKVTRNGSQRLFQIACATRSLENASGSALEQIQRRRRDDERQDLSSPMGMP